MYSVEVEEVQLLVFVQHLLFFWEVHLCHSRAVRTSFAFSFKLLKATESPVCLCQASRWSAWSTLDPWNCVISNTLRSTELFRNGGAKQSSPGDVRIKGMSNITVYACPLNKWTTELLSFGTSVITTWPWLQGLYEINVDLFCLKQVILTFYPTLYPFCPFT